MIQYFPMLVMYEHKRLLFHVTPCHHGACCGRQFISLFEMRTLRMNPKNEPDCHKTL